MSIIYSFIFISPKSDDGVYHFASLSVLFNGYPSINFNEEIVPIFFIFPTYPFINGLILSFINYIGFSINEYNYKILVLFFSILNIFLIRYIFCKIFYNNFYCNLIISLFLILLSVTPFVNNFYLNRPQAIGLFIIFLIYLLNYNLELNKINKFTYYIFGFLLGFLFILHPIFSIISLFFSFYLLIKFSTKINLKNIFFSILIFIITIFPFLYWIFINQENFFDQVFNRISNDLEFDNFNNTIYLEVFTKSFFLGNHLLINKFYNFIFNFPLLISFILLFYILYNKFLNIKFKIFLDINFIIFLSIIFIIFFNRSFPPYISIISLLILFILFVHFKIEAKDFKFKKLLSIFIICTSILPLNPIILNEYKKIYYGEDNLTLIKIHTLIKNLKTDNIFVIASPNFIIPLNNNLSPEQLNKSNKTIWLNPVYEKPSNKLLKKYNKQILYIKNSNKNIYWFTQKNKFFGNCLMVSSRGPYLKFNNINSIYNNNIFMIILNNNFTILNSIEKC